MHDENPIYECDRLHKCGRATGYTQGEYSSVRHALISKHMVNDQETQRITFEHTVTSPPKDPFSLPGDSGALVFNFPCRVVGMVIGGAEMGGFTFITHIDDLFRDIKDTTGASEVRLQEVDWDKVLDDFNSR